MPAQIVDKCEDEDQTRTVRPVSGQSLFTQLEKIDIDFTVSGLPHAIVKQAENFSVRELVKKIESHPHRQALQADLQQNNVYNPFSNNSKAMIREMGNVELFELCETIPKVQCSQCLLYWNQGVIYCTCGHFLVESDSSQKFHKLRLDALYPALRDQEGEERVPCSLYIQINTDDGITLQAHRGGTSLNGIGNELIKILTLHGSRRATQRVCSAHSFHPHAIHDVCLSSCLRPRSVRVQFLSVVYLFCSLSYLYSWLALPLQSQCCGGNKSLRLRTMRSIAPCRYTILLQIILWFLHNSW